MTHAAAKGSPEGDVPGQPTGGAGTREGSRSIVDEEPPRFQYWVHRHIEMFRELGKLSRYNVGLVSFDDVAVPSWLARVGALRLVALPFALAGLLARRRDDAVFVREFLTVPLLLASPWLLRSRSRALFVLVHNVQMAHLRWRDRRALSLLFRMGFRFVALETDAGIRELGIRFREDQLLVLPLCDPGWTNPLPPARGRRESVLGVVGRARPEKSVVTLLEKLTQARQSLAVPVRIVVGSDSPAVLRHAKSLGLGGVDTTTRDAYDATLAAIDVLVVDRPRSRYLYRTSGVIADAVLRGSAVVCPAYPAFRTQISRPAVVGATFESLDRLGDAIDEALAMLPAMGSASSAHRAHRNPRRLAAMLDDWLDRHRADRRAGG